jgi:hypothetical protein
MRKGWQVLNLPVTLGSLKRLLGSCFIVFAMQPDPALSTSRRKGRLRVTKRMSAARRATSTPPSASQPGNRGRSTLTRTAALGMVERGGGVRAMRLDTLRASEIKGRAGANVALGGMVVTDQFPAYAGLGRAYDHHVVDHAKGEYARGDAHTNTIEGFRSLLERSVVGIIHHSASPKHMSRHLATAAWRPQGRRGRASRPPAFSGRRQEADVRGADLMTNEKRLKLDMDFREAMRRFGRTDPAELARHEKGIDEEIKDVKRRAKQVDENFQAGARTAKHRYRP